MKNVGSFQMQTQPVFWDSDWRHEFPAPSHRHVGPARRPLAAYARRVHQRSLSAIQRSWASLRIQSGPVVESPSAGTADAGPFLQLVVRTAPGAEGVATFRAPAQSAPI